MASCDGPRADFQQRFPGPALPLCRIHSGGTGGGKELGAVVWWQYQGGSPTVVVPCGLGLGGHCEGGKGEILNICRRQANNWY